LTPDRTTFNRQTGTRASIKQHQVLQAAHRAAPPLGGFAILVLIEKLQR
jgi:hypothetical protein